MRNLALGLVVLALVGLMAGTACAAGPAHAKAHGKTIQMAAHHGPHGPHGHQGWRRRPVHRPPMYRPPVVVPFPGYRPVVRPPVYRYPQYYGYPYYYGPSYGFRYYGSGVGISIGF